jgi:acyl CoA:acetate/3-ketoacid CoA transferase
MKNEKLMRIADGVDIVATVVAVLGIASMFYGPLKEFDRQLFAAFALMLLIQVTLLRSYISSGHRGRNED